MKKRPLSVLLFGLIAILTAANVAQSAGANASASATIVASPPVSASCDESTTGNTNLRCRDLVTVQVVRDGTLIGPQAVSLTLTREVDASNAVTATLAYD